VKHRPSPGFSRTPARFPVRSLKTRAHFRLKGATQTKTPNPLPAWVPGALCVASRDNPVEHAEAAGTPTGPTTTPEQGVTDTPLTQILDLGPNVGIASFFSEPVICPNASPRG